MRSVLFIDGPAKGQVIQCDSKAAVWCVAEVIPDLRITEYHDPKELVPGPKIVTYFFHKVAFFGRIIWTASIHILSGDINTQDLFETILSTEAKVAVEMPARGGSGRNPV